ncbi:hypothetical protein ACFQV2_17210 [Actinokineospora soli]|uniref:Beta-galactosidase n=1 Tax=Actinokineospora soli TaxID=1048753 RepID=A0ABW2TQF0_9PSEU
MLVEDQGRVNFGKRIGEPKGLIGPVELDGAALRGWELAPLPLEPVDWLEDCLLDAPAAGPVRRPGPVFAYAEFARPGPGDLALSTRGWGKGVAWLNGVNLGRFWSRGPQRTLYVPGPIVRDRNRLVVLELGAATTGARFVDALDLGPEEA